MLNFGASKPRVKGGPPWIHTWNVGEEKKTKTKHLGVTGPSQKVSLPVLDILKSMGGSDSATVKKINDKHVIV